MTNNTIIKKIFIKYKKELEFVYNNDIIIELLKQRNLPLINKIIHNKNYLLNHTNKKYYNIVLRKYKYFSNISIKDITNIIFTNILNAQVWQWL